MNPAPRFSSRLRKLAREGKLEQDYDTTNHRYVWWPK